MAVVFETQPGDRTGSLSPLIYQVYDATNVGNAGFYYEFEIFAWSGTAVFPGTADWTVNRKADAYGSNRGWIDIRELVQQEISKNIAVSGVFQPDINGGAKYVGVKCRGVWDAGSGSQVSSTIELITLGYNYTTDGFNPDWGAVDVYTDRSVIYLTEDTTEFYLWYNASTVTTVDLGTASQAPNVITDSNQEIQGIDIVQLASTGGVTGTDSTITFQGPAITIELKWICPSKWGEILIHYLNRYGVYESMVLNALSRRSTEITKDTYNQPAYLTNSLGDAWNFGVPLSTTFVEETKTRITANTGWIPEEDNDQVEQILVSRNVLWVDGSDLISIRATDKAFQRKTRDNDKLIQYTLNFEANQPKINTIAR